jgi:hypothetical protein
LQSQSVRYRSHTYSDVTVEHVLIVVARALVIKAAALLLLLLLPVV